jgi:hypothetical protein
VRGAVGQSEAAGRRTKRWLRLNVLIAARAPPCGTFLQPARATTESSQPETEDCPGFGRWTTRLPLEWKAEQKN